MPQPSVSPPTWIAADWSDTGLRAWALSETDLCHQAHSTSPRPDRADAVEAGLLALISDWLPEQPMPVLISGLPTAPTRPVPAPLCAPVSHPLPSRDPRLRIRALPGLTQARPRDWAWGQDLRLAGFAAFNPGWDGVVCLPGDRGLWAHISADELVSFQSTLTGQLHHSLAQEPLPDAYDKAPLLEALEATRSRPESLASVLARAGSDGARLGALIGADLAAARAYWLGQPVAVIGQGALAQAYLAGLRAQGAVPLAVDPQAATLRGLIAHRATLDPIPD